MEGVGRRGRWMGEGTGISCRLLVDDTWTWGMIYNRLLMHIFEGAGSASSCHWLVQRAERRLSISELAIEEGEEVHKPRTCLKAAKTAQNVL